VGTGDRSPFGVSARLFLRRRLPPFGWAPLGAFTFAHVDDVVAGMLAAAVKSRPARLYFLAGDGLTLRQMMDVWERCEGRRPVRLWLPRSVALAQAAVLGPLVRVATGTEFISPEAVRSAYVSFRYTSDKARRELGVTFRPADQAWQDVLREERSLLSSRPPAAER
jgi:dihydroflavonol-4-reductase